MMYILSEEEFENLRQSDGTRVDLTQKQLQSLCTKIADTMPITLGWGIWKEKPTPWGCIKTVEYEWYCDSCPVEKICPSDYKSWSK